MNKYIRDKLVINYFNIGMLIISNKQKSICCIFTNYFNTVCENFIKKSLIFIIEYLYIELVLQLKSTYVSKLMVNYFNIKLKKG